MNAITVIGCGPGAPEYVSEDAILEIQGQTNLCGSKRLLSLISRYRIDGTVLKGQVADALFQIEQLAQNGTVGVMVSGDPEVFSLAKSVKEKFGEQVRRVVPGIGAGEVALREIGVSEENAYFVSLHGGDVKVVEKSPRPLFSKWGRGISPHSHPTLFFMGGPQSYQRLSDHAQTLADNASWYWCEDLTLNTQQIVPITVADIERRKPSPKGRGLVIIAGIPTQGRKQ